MHKKNQGSNLAVGTLIHAVITTALGYQEGIPSFSGSITHLAKR